MERASTADMVKDAIKTLGERGGSSLHNIKKYIEAVYQVDMRYRARLIRKFLRSAVSDGDVVQTRGRGASGSFKLPPKQPKQQAPASAPAQRVAAVSGKASQSSTVASASSTSTSAPRSSPSSASSTASSTASSRSARDERARARADRRQ